MREPTKTIVRLLQETPEDWTFDRYCAKHTPSGCEVWIASGWGYCRLYEPTFHLPLWDRWRLWRVVWPLAKKYTAKHCQQRLESVVDRLNGIKAGVPR